MLSKSTNVLTQDIRRVLADRAIIHANKAYKIAYVKAKIDEILSSQGYINIGDASQATGIPEYVLTRVIEKEYGMLLSLIHI